MGKKLFYFLSFILTLSAISAEAVYVNVPEIPKSEINTPKIRENDEVFIEADEMDYDGNSKVITATGRVEILRGENVLFADRVVYSQLTNEVSANGNVVVTGKDGNTMFTDNFVLKDDFKGGVVNFFRTRLSDGSLLAAARARRISDNKLILNRAVYSPCPVCTNDPESDPQWQLKASKVIVDDVEQQVTYRDARMEVYGLPVFYTPYFSHPTPNADAKSGILMPAFESDSNLGFMVTTPYYWNIAPNIDFTATPIITTKEGIVGAGELRHATPYGDYNLAGSLTHARKYNESTGKVNDERDWRGHIKGDGLFDLTENWDIGFDGEFTSDDTYLRRYNYGNEDLLTSRAFLERIENRNYSSLQTVYFQGLLEQDRSDTTPFALPYIRNHFETERGIIPGLDGSKLLANFTGFAVERDVGEESQRMSFDTGVFVPFTTSHGQIIELEGNIRADQFFLENSPANPHEQRLIPEASITWRLPLMNQITSSGKLLLEPITKFIVSPNKDYNRDIPNEDSQDIEFSDLNIFDNNRFRGIDRIESGTRVYYGLRGGYYEDDFSVSYLLGQNYRVEKPETILPENTGLENSLSDYVGRVSANFYNVFDLAYKFRYDGKDLTARRNEVDLTIDYDRVKLSLNYFFLDYDFTNPNEKREEVNAMTSVKFADNWSVLFGGSRNLAEGQNIDIRTGLLYEDECTNVLTTVRREFISDRDAESGTSIGLQIGLKNLGGL